ncbi:hypothetical protein MBANPS3_012094 [Mucor bainieri]
MNRGGFCVHTPAHDTTIPQHLQVGVARLNERNNAIISSQTSSSSHASSSQQAASSQNATSSQHANPDLEDAVHSFPFTITVSHHPKHKLKKLEAQRRVAARLFRKHEKEHKSLDPTLYGQLKDIWGQCNALYLKQQKLQQSKSQDQSQLYILNKKLHNQRLIAAKPAPAPLYFDTKTKIQGIDPGAVAMANGVCSSQKPLFESINCYEALQDHQESIYHGMDQDVAFDMTAKVVNAAVDTKTSPNDSPKKKQEKKVKSKCRLRQFYAKHCAQHRPTMRSKSRMDANGQDTVIKTDEFASSVTCNSCFQRTKKQTQRRPNGKLAIIKGAAAMCINPEYPRRKFATTINRDQNGARNIALIGFSRMVSQDGLPLPPFQSTHKSNKYTLSTNFMSYQCGDDVQPSQRGDEFQGPLGLIH